MKKKKGAVFLYAINVVTVTLVISLFLSSFAMVRHYAREDCMDRIQETTTQMSYALNHAIDDAQAKLTVFADILAANESNPDEQLQAYMETFVQTQYFSAVCVHRRDGSTVFYGDDPHMEEVHAPFEEDVQCAPYISEIFSEGDHPEDKSFYQAVPVIRDGETAAILYGYITLDKLPEFVTATAYDGACQLYVVDGDTGNFLMDTWHGGVLSSIDSLGQRETKPGYDLEEMRRKIRDGESGYFIFRSRTTGEWFYTCFMPTGINNWSIQLTIDEPTAFASYDQVNRANMAIAAGVIVLMLIHITLLMMQSTAVSRRDKAQLRKSRYMYEVQRLLLNAHHDPDFVEQALRRVATEINAETVLLLSFVERQVDRVYFWPSTDKTIAESLLGRNIRTDFPVFFDMLTQGQSVIHYVDDATYEISVQMLAMFQELEVRNISTVPVLDTAGKLRGTLCGVNLRERVEDSEMLECVTYDFFMAIANIENHSMIKRMGEVDYLTSVRNRNSYEAELPRLVYAEGKSLWCVFIDVNGLHEVNNRQGHKAGDLMLVTVAEVIKRTFGVKRTYRVGGDEFVAFATDSTPEEFLRKKQQVIAELAAQGYYVSIGFEHIDKEPDGIFDVARLVESAEAVMYSEKREYYRKRGKDHNETRQQHG